MNSLDVTPLLKILSQIDQAYSHLVELDEASETLSVAVEPEQLQPSTLELARDDYHSHLVALSYAVRVQIAQLHENGRIGPAN